MSSARWSKFNKVFKKAIHSKEGYDDILTVNGGTWCAGGCYILASALRVWSGNRFFLVSIKKKGSNSAEHFVACHSKESLCIDGDGVQRPSELLRKMECVEHLPDPRFDLDYVVTDDIPHQPEKIKQTADLLKRKLGNFEKWGF